MLSHGVVEQISPLVRRVVAPNASFMTGPGTNSYILGREAVAVIDPGPAIDSHIDALVNACAGRLKWILVTHTHPDHSPAAKALAEMTGAELMGNTITDDGYQDTTFVSNHQFSHGEHFGTDEFSLQALHTPGHVDNHFCYLVAGDNLLLTGDHLMNGSTVVIIPPHGDMQAYIRSLEMLLDFPLAKIGPGHGDVIENPLEVVRWTIAHRLKREQKVLDKLAEHSAIKLESLVPIVYDDVDTKLHGMAKYSLWAHLLKLERESRVISGADGDSWSLHGGD